MGPGTHPPWAPRDDCVYLFQVPAPRSFRRVTNQMGKWSCWPVKSSDHGQLVLPFTLYSLGLSPFRLISSVWSPCEGTRVMSDHGPQGAVVLIGTRSLSACTGFPYEFLCPKYVVSESATVSILIALGFLRHLNFRSGLSCRNLLFLFMFVLRSF